MIVKSLIKLIDKEQLIETIYAATKKMFDVEFPKEEGESGITPKAQRILDIIKEEDFGCKRESVIILMEAVTGETILPFFKDEDEEIDPKFCYKPVEMALVKVTSNDHSGLGKSDMFLISREMVEGEAKCIYEISSFKDIDDLNEGIFRSNEFYKNHIKGATKAEITKFVNTLYKD